MRGPEAKALRLLRSGRPRAALELLSREAPAGAPTSTRRAVLMGVCYAKAGMLPESESLFNIALRSRPGNPSALTGLGNVAVLKGEPGLARALYVDALECCFWCVEPRYNLVLAYQEAGQFEKSLSAYRDFRLVVGVLKWLKFLIVAATFSFLWFLLAK